MTTNGAFAQAPQDEYGQLPEAQLDLLAGSVQDLYLEVFINGEPVQMVAAARRDQAGQISMPADQLRGVGIAPQGAIALDGYVALDALDDVTYRFDEAAQALYFDADNEARAARQIGNGVGDTEESEVPTLSSGIGGSAQLFAAGEFFS